MKLYTILIVMALFSFAKLSPDSELNIIKVTVDNPENFLSISEALESNTPVIPINLVNWEKYDFAPDVAFRIGHNGETLFLKFYVTDEHIIAKHSTPNTATHRDSCVEFFIDPDQTGNYYNFEFNCIGTTHLAFGPDRHTRTFVDKSLIIDQIRIQSSLGNMPFEEKTGNFKWEMVIAIPSSIFVHHPNLSFNGLQSKANFYKCADATQKPHYLSWAPVITERPDFHRPEFFGALYFEH